LGGGIRFELPVETAITVPPDGAGPLSVTVPTVEIPPTIVVGESVKELSFAGEMVKAAVCETPARVAVMVAAVEVTTADVSIENVADFAPAATVTEAGAVALAVFDVSATDVPPDVAKPFKVTVPVED